MIILKHATFPASGAGARKEETMNDHITLHDLRTEVEDLVKAAIEECMTEVSDVDDLRGKVFDRLHETVDGHAWVIYYSKAHDVVHAVRNDSRWYDEAYARLTDTGGNVIGEDEDIGSLETRLAYWVLMTGVENAYEDTLSTVIEENIAEWKERGKNWAEGFKAHNSTREEAYEAEENGRQYSPFEFTAKAINDLPWSDDAWEAFQEGIDEVFSTMIGEDDVEYWLCPDCLQAAVNDDYSGLDYSYTPKEAEKRQKDIQAGLDELGNITNTGHVLTFSSHGCDCCRSKLAGELHGFMTIRIGGDK